MKNLKEFVVLLVIMTSLAIAVIFALAITRDEKPPAEQSPVQISAEQAYQIGYEHGINAGIAGVWLRTNKEVYYINEIKWRANRFHNDITSLGRDGKTNGVDFCRPVPVNTNYLEYRKEEWPTNEL